MRQLNSHITKNSLREHSCIVNTQKNKRFIFHISSPAVYHVNIFGLVYGIPCFNNQELICCKNRKECDIAEYLVIWVHQGYTKQRGVIFQMRMRFQRFRGYRHFRRYRGSPFFTMVFWVLLIIILARFMSM